MIYILDLKTGALLRTIDTGLKNAFAGSMLDATIDTDKWNPGIQGVYEDNVIYIPYTQMSAGSWVGGVLRLTTGGSVQGEDSNVGHWSLSTLITVPGAVTTSVSHLQDRTNHKLWLYFGTGRYFYKIGSTIDDANTQQKIYGIKEPCYSDVMVPVDTLDMTCTASVSASSLTDATTSPPASVSSGWFISLDPSGSSYMAERVITNPLGAYTGAVFFPTFEPTSSACGFSGNSFLWGVDYATGGSLRSSALHGMALIQVSTGQIQEVSLSSALTDKKPSGGAQGRRTAAFSGVPPKGQGLSVIINPRPLNKILQIQEK
jgi:type IV pilus assembly protein PilY1